MSCSVLCVDDDPLFGLVVDRIFLNLSQNIDVIPKTSSKEALHYLKNLDEYSFPKAIVLDINLSKANAFEFLHHMDENKHPEIPIFLISSSPFPEDKKKADQNSSIKEIFKKPFSVTHAQTILETIEGS